MFPTLMLASFGQVFLTIMIVFVSLLLMGLILLQKNRGSGLSGAFGGVGGHTAFGTKTGDFLTWVTVGLAAIFIVLSVSAVFVFERAVVAEPVQSAPATDLPVSGTAGDAQPIKLEKVETIPSNTTTETKAPVVNQPPKSGTDASAPAPTNPPAGESTTPKESTPPAGSKPN